MIQINIKIPAQCVFNSEGTCDIPTNDDLIACDVDRDTFPKDCPLRNNKIIFHTPFDGEQK